MALPVLIAFAVFPALVLHGLASAAAEKRIERMQLPIGRPVSQAEHHLCKAFRLPANETLYIQEITAVWRHERVKHVLLFGCRRPFADESTTSDDGVWSFVELSQGAGICSKQEDGHNLLLGQRQSPSLQLPAGTALPVAGSTDIRFLVIVVHFHAAVDQRQALPATTQGSGVELVLLPRHEVQQVAGVVRLGATSGVVPPHGVHTAISRCRVTGSAARLQPLLFKVHMHALGLLVSASKVDARTGEETLIASSDPQDLQVLRAVPRRSSLTLSSGDWLDVRCLLNNTRHEEVHFGNKERDEMCDFELVYGSQGDDIWPDFACVQSISPVAV